MQILLRTGIATAPIHTHTHTHTHTHKHTHTHTHTHAHAHTRSPGLAIHNKRPAAVTSRHSSHHPPLLSVPPAPTLSLSSLPLLCHCERSPAAAACPTSPLSVPGKAHLWRSRDRFPRVTSQTFAFRSSAARSLSPLLSLPCSAASSLPCSQAQDAALVPRIPVYIRPKRVLAKMSSNNIMAYKNA